MRKLLVVMVLLAFLVPMRADAQTTLTDEEMVLLDRALDALAAVQDYESFTRSDVTSETSLTLLVQGEISDITRESRVLEQEYRYVGDMAQGNFRGTYFSDVNGLSYAFTMMGEVRFVEDMLYVAADYEKTTGTVPTLQEGWLVDQAALNNQVFVDLLDIENLYEQFRGEGYSTFVDASEMVKLLVDQVSSRTITLPDGGVTEEISFRVPSSGLYTLASQNPDFDPLNPVLQIYRHTSPDSMITVKITLDSAGYVAKTAYTYRLDMPDVDMHALDTINFPEGTIGTFQFDYAATRYYSNINQPLEPVQPPT